MSSCCVRFSPPQRRRTAEFADALPDRFHVSEVAEFKAIEALEDSGRRPFVLEAAQPGFNDPDAISYEMANLVSSSHE